MQRYDEADRRREIRRPRHGRGAAGARLRPRHRAAGADRHQSGGGAWRRPADRRHAEAARHQVGIRRGCASPTPPPSRSSRWCWPARSTSRSSASSTTPAAGRSGSAARTATWCSAQVRRTGGRPGLQHREGHRSRLRRRARKVDMTVLDPDPRPRPHPGAGAGRGLGRRHHLQHQRRHLRGRDRGRASCQAPALPDRRSGRARQVEEADRGAVGRRCAPADRRRHDLGRHDPEGRDLHRRARAGRRGRRHPRRQGAARGAARAAHRSRRRHAAPDAPAAQMPPARDFPRSRPGCSISTTRSIRTTSISGSRWTSASATTSRASSRSAARGGLPRAEGLLQALRHLDARADDRARHEARRFPRLRASDRSFAARAEPGARARPSRRLPGRKLILTNGTRRHADAVLARLERPRTISTTCSISWRPSSSRSPRRRPMRAFLAPMRVDPRKAAMFEDLARNLAVPHARHDHGAGRAGGHPRGVSRGLGVGRARRRRTSTTSPTTSRRFSLASPHRIANAQRKSPMTTSDLEKTIDAAFEARSEIGPTTKGAVREAVDTALDLLDTGAARVAEKGAGGAWRVHQWLKKAVLLSFRLKDMSAISGGPAALCGGTRCRQNSTAGRRIASAMRDFAPCPGRSCGARPMSRPASC